MYRRIGGTKEALYDQGLYFFLRKRKGKSPLENRIFFFVHRIVSAVKSVEFVSDSMSCTVPMGRWFNSIVWNIRASNEKKAMFQKTTFMRN